MKQYLLPEKGNFYKANLHCHTVVSDGKMTPQEVKEAYLEKGYSIVAYTDHNLMVSHSDLADENFLPLTGVEMDISEGKKGEEKFPYRRKTCHFCIIALEPDNVVQPMWHSDKRYLRHNNLEYEHLAVYDKNEPDYVRQYSVEGINDMMRIAREKGFFVTYNHPVWSRETYPEYTNYKGMHAMEIANFTCINSGHDEYNPRIYDEILETGNRIYCIGADDTHSKGGVGGCFTVIKAEKLEYRTVTKALENGEFYASMGPQIHELYIEGDEVHIKCSPAREVSINYGCRKRAKKRASNGELVTEASFKLDPKIHEWIRLTVIDECGMPANTNAYYLENYDIVVPEEQ